MLKQIEQTKLFLLEYIKDTPKVGVVLGSGLGNLSSEIETEHSFDYSEVPNFPVSTVEGHSGKLIIGKINGVAVIAMKGRFHYYEGYDMKQCTFPLRVMKSLGIESLIISNASGGTNADFAIGDIMLINDHINLFSDNPLRGKNFDKLGPRFPDMSEPYSKKLNNELLSIAAANNIDLKQGVYLGWSGPTYETPAEYKMLSILGADAVGMSTVPEVIVANHMNLPCVALSIITDLGVEGKIVEINHEEVQDVAEQAEPKMTLLIKELLKSVYANNSLTNV